MDLLSSVLATVRLKASGWHICDFTAPWAIATTRGFAEPFFLSIVGNDCWLTFEDNPPMRMKEGDLILVLRGGSYTVASDVQVPTVAWDDAFAPLPWSDGIKMTAPRRLSYGGGGAATRMIGAAFGFGNRGRNPLLSALPPYICLANRHSHLLPVFRFAREFLEGEEQHPMPGYSAVAERMAELVFINIIRSHLRLQPDETTGWLRGLSDTRIARALAAIHERPDQPWTVSTLAKEASMSRAVFAQKFHALIGRSPGDYLTEWRIYLAAGQIATSVKPIATIAAEVGYQSVNAFTHAFKRSYGSTPGEYRNARK